MRFTLLPRKKDTDKSSYGHALVIAGSRTYPGAALLTAVSALRAGAGLVTMATCSSAHGAILRRVPPEIMPVFLPETKKGSVSDRAFSIAMRTMVKRRVNVVALGPGLTHEPSTSRLVRKLVNHLDVPVVLDADGLNSFKGYLKALKSHSAPLVLTPHRREFERLFKERVPVQVKKLTDLAKKLSKFYDVVLVLKGHKTLTVYHDKLVWNATGNPGMAKGGSGDVLTGVIAAFIAQGLEPFQAAVWGVYFHGKAGDLAVRCKGELSLTASDLIDFLPKAFRARRARLFSLVGKKHPCL